MMITATDDLQKICKKLAKSPYVAIDTEFIREKTYYPVLCLIQIAGPTDMACIDPLAQGIDLSPFFDLLQNPKVVKVFHAGRQDIEIFYHLTKKIPTPLFDTQTAAMVCGYDENVGYQQLVNDICHVALDKSMQITDWSRRPLSEKQVEYALHDVTYLRDIYAEFCRQLKKNGRTAWLTEEIERQNNPLTYEPDEATYWQRFKLPFKKSLQIYVFSKLCTWREQKAKQKNRPRKHILKDEVLLELAATLPENVTDLDHCRGLSQGFGKSTMGQEILSVIKLAQADPVSCHPTEWAKPKPLTVAQHTFIDLLRILLGIVAGESGVAPKIIATAEMLQELARGNNDVPCMKGWRQEIFGNKVLLFRQGKLVFGFNPKTHQPEVRIK